VAVITVTVRDSGLDGEQGNNDDALVSRTFTVQVNPPGTINQSPSFIKGSNKQATDDSGVVTSVGWATQISAGPPSESAQSLTFLVTPDNPQLFASGPSISSTGTLTFTPAPNVKGLAHVTVRLKDNGGTANGGTDTSGPQTFDITITKPHPKHNTALALDVTNDSFRVPEDALAVINFINAFGPTVVPLDAPIGPPFLDTTGDDNIAPDDALAIINHINAFGPDTEAEGESSGDSLIIGNEDLMGLLALDVAAQSRRRR
jgi:hypothetical protein